MTRKTEPPQPTRWDIYRAAAKGKPLGTVEAADADEAVTKAAAEFKVDVWRLYGCSGDDAAQGRNQPSREQAQVAYHVALSAGKVRGVMNSQIVWSFAETLSEPYAWVQHRPHRRVPKALPRVQNEAPRPETRRGAMSDPCSKIRFFAPNQAPRRPAPKQP
jgi:hypothetical protein